MKSLVLKCEQNNMQNRIPQYDYMKCIFIILMIVFHLVYIGDKYPYAKQVVYMFHMPVFLYLSGYLANMDKGAGRMLRQIWWLFVPYAVMESGYVVMASVLPIREHINALTPGVFAAKLLLDPLGPYWYLHTLIICYAAYYAVSRLGGRLTPVSLLAVLGSIMWLLADVLHIMAMENAMYFLLGAATRRLGARLLSVLRPSWLAVVPLVILCSSSDDLHKYSLKGVAVTYLAMCLSLAAYNVTPARIRAWACMVGENTLSILLFSAMFTIMTKPLVPLFAFDPTGLLFTTFAVAFTVAGSLGVAKAMDALRLSRLFCGKERLLSLEYLNRKAWTETR